MSKVIYICKNKSPVTNGEISKLKKICKSIEPKNVKREPKHKVIADGKTAMAIMNYQSFLKIKNNSLLLGFISNHFQEWNKPTTVFPDGSYAIFRNDKRNVEIVTDSVASRTIWYYFNDEIFIASTSQIAIVLFLEKFQFDKKVIPWILSSGSLGPEFSWDERVKRLQPNSRFTINKIDWSTSKKEYESEFKHSNNTYEEYKKNLKNTIVRQIDIVAKSTIEEWALLLSGGYDSRAILLFLNESADISKKLKTVTFGLKESIENPKSDISIASKIANKFNTNHIVKYTNASDNNISEVIDQFILCGEGRVDQIYAYLDGMKMWAELLNFDNIKGMIRGDVGFSTTSTHSEKNIRHNLGLSLCSDFKNLDFIQNEFDMPNQELTQYLERQNGESLVDWRDRLYQTYRIPTILASLSDIKLTYVELITPLLANSVISLIRKLPEDLRKNKKIFRDIVEDYDIDIDFSSKKNVNKKNTNIYDSIEFQKLLEKRLKSSTAREIFSEDFLKFVIDGANFKSQKSKNNKLKKIATKLYGVLPPIIKNRYRNIKPKPSINKNLLSFRVYLIIRFHEILTDQINNIKTH